MKNLIVILALLCTFVVSAPAQYQTATSTGTGNVAITIPAGQVMQVFNFTHDVDFGFLTLTKGSITQYVFQSVNIGGGSGNIARESYFVGPATINMAGSFPSSKLCLSYKLFENSTVAGTTVPYTAVVIPADATGPVNIILESSTDLVTWTAASPGSYGSSTVKRFFRVRAVAQ